ncbi:hypothetical protein CMV_010387 [Castanea mollissima]|uniref:Nucleolar protein 16 n=1 Tax=Castanea mollissima TaxID=60419 RepID=A0A8J4RFF6_9ROSI|nr:hypothetical protein CMV_010387 [Castanea mollissima]
MAALFLIQSNSSAPTLASSLPIHPQIGGALISNPTRRRFNSSRTTWRNHPQSSDLKSALGKKRKDGKSTPPLPLTTIQRVHISRLVEKYGDNYERMFMDSKLNAMQHSVATLEKLCKSLNAGACPEFVLTAAVLAAELC